MRRRIGRVNTAERSFYEFEGAVYVAHRLVGFAPRAGRSLLLVKGDAGPSPRSESSSVWRVGPPPQCRRRF